MPSRLPFVPFLLFLLLLPVSAIADEARLNCTADTSISSYPSESEFNYGQSSRLRLKGIESMALFQFDLSPVKNWKVGSATLFLRYAGGDRKLRTLGFSTIAAPWTEGTGASEKKAGEVSFAWRETGKTTWAGPQTDFTDVSFSAGHTLSSYADIHDQGDGWFSVEVDPKIVQAMIAGFSYGMAVTDEKGQTRANNDVFSREQSNSQPYMVVKGLPLPPGPPARLTDLVVEPQPAQADFDSGAVSGHLVSHGGAFGYRVRYSLGGTAVEVPRRYMALGSSDGLSMFTIPGLPVGRPLDWLEFVPVDPTGVQGNGIRSGSLRLDAKSRPLPLKSLISPPAPKDASTVSTEIEGVLRVWVYPEGAKAHPVSGNLFEEVGPERYGAESSGTYRQRNSVWNGGHIRLFAAKGEILGFNLLVQALVNSVPNVTVEVSKSFTSASGINFDAQPALFRAWYVRDHDWMPEAAVPLKGEFSIPAADNAVLGQRNQTVAVDLIVPKTARTGAYSGRIMVSAAGKSVTIPIDVTVNDLTLPDTLTFDVSLNGYGTVGGPFEIDDRTAEYRALEREYHRIAHLHRTTLALLGYSHTGRITSNYAPPITGEESAAHVTDWSAWDAQFGPYLDGTAFSDLPRAGVPVSHLYLPFHEAWPADIRKYYHFTPTVTTYPAMIVEHALKAAPILEAMDRALAMEFQAVLRQANEHFQAKGWTKSSLQIYLNDKNYYKDPKQGGQGTSWWLLDEPNHRDDWLAIAYFGQMVKQLTQRRGPIRFREDISRPEWQRDYLPGMVDLMVVGGSFFRKQPLMREMKRNEAVRFWNYGTANEVRASNLEAEAWALKAWLHGADGIVPWNSIGSDKNYVDPDATALILPGKRFGITGPVASLRLKALRRAQQDVEYLVLLAKAKGWDRDQVAEALKDILSLKADFRQTGPEDAGKYNFEALRAESFDAMRRATAEAISHK